MQVVNFLVCGTLVLVFAIALRQVIKGSRGSIVGPVLLGLFAVALLVAGAFVTDPALGYPVGAPQVHTTHGIIHGLAGLAAFTFLPATAFVMAWHFAGARPPLDDLLARRRSFDRRVLRRQHDRLNDGRGGHLAERADWILSADRDHRRLDLDRHGRATSTPHAASWRWRRG